MSCETFYIDKPTTNGKCAISHWTGRSLYYFWHAYEVLDSRFKNILADGLVSQSW